MQSNIMFMYAIFIKCFFLIFHQNCGTSKISQSDKSCNSNLFSNKKKTLWWLLLFLLKWTFMQILCQFLHEKKRLHNCFVILFRFSTFSKCLSYFLWVNFEIVFCLFLMYVNFFKIYILVVLFWNLLLFHNLKQKIEEEKNRKNKKAVIPNCC